MLKRDWDLLAVGATTQNLLKGQVVIDNNACVSHLFYINNGRCTVEVRF